MFKNTKSYVFNPPPLFSFRLGGEVAGEGGLVPLGAMDELPLAKRHCPGPVPFTAEELKELWEFHADPVSA